jgi:hypothetical protein
MDRDQLVKRLIEWKYRNTQHVLMAQDELLSILDEYELCSHPEGGVPDSPGRYRMSVEVEIGHCEYVGRDTDQSCAGCSQLRIIDPEVVCPFEWLDGAVFRAIEEG